MRSQLTGLAVGIVVGVVIGVGLGPVVAWQSAPASTAAVAADSDELRRMHDEDQADRKGPAINWNVVGPRDSARLRRVKELFAADGLHTANDYYRSAMILQHSHETDDYLLAHELSVAAMSLGKNDKAAKWLAAAAEDRFLMNLGRPQRFGTQYKSGGSGPVRLYTTSEQMTDTLRRLMDAPTLAEAKAREAEMNK